MTENETLVGRLGADDRQAAWGLAEKAGQPLCCHSAAAGLLELVGRPSTN